MRKTSQNEPIGKFLEDNRKKKPVSFHMPGHKYGRFPYKGRLHSFASYDITEIPGADNIQKADGIIGQSLDMISKAYGSGRTFFLTNGTSGGIHAVMKYFSKKGGTVLVSRDCHSSVVNGAILFNVPLSFIPVDYESGIPMPVTPDSVRSSVEECDDCCGVLITSPNYYGIVASIKEISSYLKTKGILLAVDEAHGAHFAFSGLHELSGIANGADIVCHSLHKTLPVYNQGSVLHVNGSTVDPDEIGSIIRMLGTSSPSYPILASMEKAVSYYRENGRKLYGWLAVSLGRLRMNLMKKGFASLPNDDFSRLVIDVFSKKADGCKVYEALCNEGVFPEACDRRYLTFITTPSNNERDFRRLERKIVSICSDPAMVIHGSVSDTEWIIPEKAMEIHEALAFERQWVPMDRAAGSICGTIIIPYPPGVPCLYPGEIITGETVVKLRTFIEGNGVVLGLDKGMIPVLERT